YLLVEDLAAPATPIETPLRGIAAHDADSAAVLVFTSGTTGTPRAVELTHRNLLSNVRSLLAVRRVTPSDSMLAMLSPSEPFALTAGLLAPLSCGARVVFTIPLPPNRLLELCRREEITHTLLVPALVELLVREVLDDLHASPSSAPAPAAPERTTSALRERLGPQFRHLAVGGAALDPALAALLAGSGFEVDVGYGLAEASPIVAVGSLATTPRGSVGRPLPGVTVAVSEAGEILVRGPNVMPRYVDDSEATAVALRDGWLHTGDSGVVDPDGFVFVLGRIKEIMVTPSGQTIHPEEVEPFYASTLFAEHCVAGIPDASGNDIPTLFLVPTDRETCVQALSREVRSLRASAPPRARIEGWVLVDRALPRTALGKIRRRQLAAQWCDERREVA
ncbi:MAG: class I adenylate-forming enzyme family protein, partial [Planctomycetota bacterium]